MGEITQILDDAFDAFSLVSAGNYVMLYDVAAQMTRFSRGAVELFGLRSEYVPDGKEDWTGHVHPDDRNRYKNAMTDMLEKGKRSYNLTYRVRLADGTYGMFRHVGAVIRNNDGAPMLIGGICLNETILENTDPITVLRNKQGFFSDLGSLMEMQKIHRILLVGITDFNQINEEFGYGYGNKVLQQVGWYMQEAVAGRGVVYRMDGSKFAFVTDALSMEEMTAKYNEIRQVLMSGIQVEDVRQSLHINGGLISTAIMQLNEQAFYSCLYYAYMESRERRHGELVVFDSTTRDKRKALKIIDEMRNCVVHNCKGFSLVYQPVMEKETEKCIGAEVLLHYESEQFGVVKTTDYVPILERDYIFEELGYWVLQHAMIEGRRVLEKNPDFKFSVNIAPAQIEDDCFVEELKGLLEETGFPAESLRLELTKGCRLLDEQRLKKFVRAVQVLGIKVYIDDFGSGFASIDFLRMLKADFVKFDKKYVLDIEENAEDRQIVEHLTEMANACGTRVCLKGIENEKIRRSVEDLRVYTLQGFLYAKGLPVEELIERFV